MTAAALVARARAVGVVLRLTATGKVGAKGPADAVDALSPELRQYKAALLALLSGPSSAPCADSGPPPQLPHAPAGDALVTPPTPAEARDPEYWLAIIQARDAEPGRARNWLIDGVLHGFCPGATAAEVRDWYPGAMIEEAAL